MSSADYQRRWRASKDGAGQPGRPVTQPCGTVSAYKRHLRRGEAPCEACRAANAENQRRLYRQRIERNPRVKKQRPSLEERFWAKVDRSRGPDSCWVWTGARNGQGYGSISSTRHRGGSVSAHRLSWELANGRLPKALVLHSCDNPPCANPAHLREGDDAQNAADYADRAPCGTIAAYKRHQRHGEAPCGPCREAWASYQRERYAARRG